MRRLWSMVGRLTPTFVASWAVLCFTRYLKVLVGERTAGMTSLARVRAWAMPPSRVELDGQQTRTVVKSQPTGIRRWAPPFRGGPCQSQIGWKIECCTRQQRLREQMGQCMSRQGQRDCTPFALRRFRRASTSFHSPITTLLLVCLSYLDAHIARG